MKKFLFLFATILLVSNLNALSFNETSDIVFKAMKAEMTRTMTSLKTKGMPKPYYAAYRVKVQDIFSVNSFMGQEYLQNESKGEISLDVMMRVGDSKLDNSFFENTVISTADSQLPSLSYESLTRALWLQTDIAYKQALDQYTKKIAYLKKKHLKQEEPDFSKAEISSSNEEVQTKPFNKQDIVELSKIMSEQGNVKDIKKFYVSITVYQGPVFFLSSEGSQYIKDDSRISITMKGDADTPGGFPLSASKVMLYKDIEELPNKEALVKIAKEFSDELQASVHAPKSTAYIGPVLLEGKAAMTLFSQIFAQSAIRTKKVLSLNNDKDYNMGEFAQKKDLKVMPVDFNVIDDPEITEFNGKKLLGSYKVDDEGVKPQKLQLVKDGKLINLPATRSSTKTNGHARLGAFDDKLFAQDYISNLFIFPQKTYPKDELKQLLMEKCAKENLDYCYIIKDFGGRNIIAYKVNAKTGEETITYGFELPTLSARTLRDIIAAGNDLSVYNIFQNGMPPFSIISPSVILSELELQPSQEENKKPPKLTKPEIE